MQYKVVNITVKEPIICPKTGKDLRTPRQKRGHPVAFRTGKDVRVEVSTHQAKLVDDLCEQLMSLARRGHVSIEKIGDVSALLKTHTLRTEKSTIDDLFAPDKNVPPPRAKEQSERMAKVSYMGEPTPPDKPVDPDGKSKFVVTVGKDGKRKGVDQPTAES